MNRPASRWLGTRTPAGSSLVEAATLPMNGLTARLALDLLDEVGDADLARAPGVDARLDRAADVVGHPGEKAIGVCAAQADQPHAAIVADHQ